MNNFWVVQYFLKKKTFELFISVGNNYILIKVNTKLTLSTYEKC